MLFLFAVILAGTPSFKGAKLQDDGETVAKLKTQSTFGTTTATLTFDDQVVVFSLAPAGPQMLLSADFQGLGLNFGGMVDATTPQDVVIEWWNAGVIDASGAHREPLESWVAAKGFSLNDTEAQRQQLMEYAAENPGPTFDTPAADAPAPATTTAAASTPSVVSVRIHVSCDTKVRMFTGSSPTSGGTYGWQSSNSTFSKSVAPGSVICIADERDTVQSCWTAGTSSADLDLGCGAISER
jgi:hypothetical protein